MEMELNQDFDDGFSLESIHHVQICSSLKLTYLDIPDQKVFKHFTT